MSELRPMVNMINPEEQRQMEEELHLKEIQENKEYLICYVLEFQSENMNEWNIIKGRDNVISFIRGIIEQPVEDGIVNIEESFMLVNSDNITLEDRITLKEFIDHVNQELEEPICYE